MTDQKEPTLYELLRDAGATIENHESDMHIRRDTDSARIINEWKAAHPHFHFDTFIGVQDAGIWYDVPFMYDPWWDARTK